MPPDPPAQLGRPDSPALRDGEVDVRLVRPADLLDARLGAPGCTLDTDDDGGPVLVAHGDESSLVLHLPPQHLGERAWQEGTTPGDVSAHRAAAPTRLVFALPDAARIRLTLADVLAALPALPLRVAAAATAVPEDGGQQAWAGPLLGPDRRRVLEQNGSVPLTDLVRGAVWPTAPAPTALPGTAAGVLAHAAAARLVRGHTRQDAPGTPALALRAGRGGPAALARPEPARDPGPGHLPVGPGAPADAETAIEAPYRLTVSPSVHGAFRHDAEPVTAARDAGRVELWRTHLTVRTVDPDGTFTGHDDGDDVQRIVRAVWSRDLDPLDAGATADPAPLHPQSLVPAHRRSIVRQTSDQRLPAPPRPLRVRSLALSSLGAWIDWAGTWESTEVTPGSTALAPPVDSYRHQAVMGRDSYVRVTEPGFLFPFGHRAVWVTVSERKVLNRDQGVAYLWRRNFIIVGQPTRSYDGHDTPLGQVTLEPLVTPDLDPVPNLTVPFVPTQGTVPFPFSLVSLDQAGDRVTFSAPLLFVSDGAVVEFGESIDDEVRAKYADVDSIPGRGQRVTVARSATPGDTAVEATRLRFTGAVDRAQRTSRPWLVGVAATVPSMRHLAPQSPAVELVYAPPYLAADAAGFGAGNPGQVFLALAGTPPVMDFSSGSERSGGFLTPNLAVRALSRSLGAVGENGSGPDSGLAAGEFRPARFLDGVLPKLFGLFSLVELLEAAGVPLDKAPAFVTEALDAVSALVSEADRLRAAATQVSPRLVEEAARAAHEGARAGVEATRVQLEEALTPLLGTLDVLVDRLGELPGSADPDGAVAAVRAALGEVATALDLLLARLGAPQRPAAVRASLQRPALALARLARAEETVTAVADVVRGLLSPTTAVTARLEWRPLIHGWPAGAPVFDARDRQGLRLAVEVRTSATTPPRVDVAAEVVDFALRLLPDEPLMAIAFQRIGFRATSGSKPEVDVVFGGIEFLGALAFIDTLRRMIPFDGFADPPFVDVTPEGVTAGFDLALPNVSVGVFSLENIALGADARMPFLGDAVTVGFAFCSKDAPFRLTVMMVGGGGWVGLRASPKGMVLLEMGLEAAASLSVDLGVASGSVSVAAGVYLRLEGDKGSLTAYFRIRGEVDVLGLISASITLELSLEYHFDTGKLVGRASLVVEVEVLFFSASVEITVERQLAGSKGDPVLADVLPPGPDGTNPDWSAYCAAFAPVAPVG